MKTQQELYPEFEKMIQAFAWVNYRKAGESSVQVGDFISEAYLIFHEAVDKFDRSKGSFSNYLWNKLYALNDVTKKERKFAQRHKSIAPPSDEDGEDLDPFQLHGKEDPSFATSEFQEYLKTMPRDARLMALWYFGGELSPPYDSHEKKHQLLKPWSIYLRKAKKFGWDWPRTQDAFQDLKLFMKLYKDAENPFSKPALTA